MGILMGWVNIGAISTAIACSMGVSKYQVGNAVPINNVGKITFAAASVPKDKAINNDQPLSNIIIEMVFISNICDNHINKAAQSASTKKAIIE